MRIMTKSLCESHLCLIFHSLLVLIITSLVTKSNAENKAAIEDSTKICSLPRNHGLGEGAYIRWYFDYGSASCTEFKFKGIGGNDNNFKTMDECQTNCPCPKVTVQENCMVYLLAKNSIGCPIPSKIECRPVKSYSVLKCLEPQDQGPCTEYSKRWYYNETSGQCENFQYGGCGGNGNNFESHFSCSFLCRNIKTTTKSPADNATMPIPSRCNEIKDTGPCSTRIQRWYYNGERKQCDTFEYSGCEGNGNNFHTLDQCNSVCRVRDSITTATTEDPTSQGSRTTDIGTSTTDLPEQFTFHHTDDFVVRVMSQTSETPPFTQTPSEPVKIANTISSSPLATTSMIYEINSTDTSWDIMTSVSPLHVPTELDHHETITSLSQTHFPMDLDEIQTHSLHKSTTGKRFINFPLVPTKLPDNERTKQKTDQTPLQSVTSTADNNDEKSNDINSDNVSFENQLRSISKVLRFSFGTFPATLAPLETQISRQTGVNKNVPANQFFPRPSTKSFHTTTTTATSEPIQTNSDSQDGIATTDLAPEDICLLSNETGTCGESHNRYFFNKFRGQCELFKYSGCNGNKNNFENVKSCQDVCRDFLGSLYVKFAAPERLIRQ